MEDMLDKVLKCLIVVCILVLFVSMPIYIVADNTTSKDNYNKLYREYRDIREEYAEEFAELSTAYEFLELANEEQKKTIDRLISLMTVKEQPYDDKYIQQMRDDLEAYVNHIFNYYEHGFHDNNPDVSIVDYIAMKDYELLIRLGEY